MTTRYALTESSGFRGRKHRLRDTGEAWCPAKATQILTPEEAAYRDDCGNCERAYNRATKAGIQAAESAPQTDDPTEADPHTPDDHNGAPDDTEATEPEDIDGDTEADDTDDTEADVEPDESAPQADDHNETDTKADGHTGRVSIAIPSATAELVADKVLDEAVDSALLAAIRTAPVLEIGGVEHVRMSLTPHHAKELREAVEMLGTDTDDTEADDTDDTEADVEPAESAPQADDPTEADPHTPDDHNGAPDDTEATEPEDIDGDTEADDTDDTDDTEATEPEDIDGDTDDSLEPSPKATVTTAPKPARKITRASAPDVPPNRHVINVGERLIKFVVRDSYKSTDPEDAAFIEVVKAAPVTKMGAGGRLRLVLTKDQVRKLEQVLVDIDSRMKTKELPTAVTGFRRDALPVVLRQCRNV